MCCRDGPGTEGSRVRHLGMGGMTLLWGGQQFLLVDLPQLLAKIHMLLKGMGRHELLQRHATYH